MNTNYKNWIKSPHQRSIYIICNDDEDIIIKKTKKIPDGLIRQFDLMVQEELNGPWRTGSQISSPFTWDRFYTIKENKWVNMTQQYPEFRFHGIFGWFRDDYSDYVLFKEAVRNIFWFLIRSQLRAIFHYEPVSGLTDRIRQLDSEGLLSQFWHFFFINNRLIHRKNRFCCWRIPYSRKTFSRIDKK